MKIFAVALNLHDHNTYDGVFHNQRERYTRRKHNIPWHLDAYDDHSVNERMNIDDYKLNEEFYKEYFKKKDNTILAFSCTVGGVRYSKETLLKTTLINDPLVFDFKPKKLFDYYYKHGIYYIDHHQSHATYAFINSGFEESDILAIDGLGWNYKCIFVDKDQNIHDKTEELPLGWLWNQMSKLTGFGPLGASKLMGLVGYGKYEEYYYNVFELIIEDKRKEKSGHMHNEINLNYGVENLAFTLQKFTLDKIREHIFSLKTSDNLCLAGGVTYNGYMNEEFTKHYKNVFVPPAVGDEGQSIGCYQHADYTLNKNKHISSTFGGEEYPYSMITGPNLDIKKIAQSIADGKIVGWYQGKSESGNRALGNRSILADPRNLNIKDIINHTIKQREDFRPFAPAVLEEHYKEYFDTNSPSPYMSRIVKVKSDKIPGVTHVDNTARIQTVNRKFNEKFYDLINEFYKITGIPMLLNTSFNCKEPIVETPQDAIRTWKRTELDILVINNYVLEK
tara:strand:- start:262 stop:1779 length:1518 start_codon:yes stop_codon:yes gene_type:complete